MTKAKISEYDAVASNNTDVNGVNIAENCPPSGMNNMGREIMAALKRFQVGSDSDGVTVGGNLVVSGTSTVNTFTAGPVSATTLNTSGAVVFNDAGADVDFRVEGDTDANLLVVDAGADAVGIGTSSPVSKLDVSYGGFQNSTGAIAIGANVGNNTARTDATRKFGVFSGVHYTNAEENICIFLYDSDSTETGISYGGGPSGFNTTNVHKWFTGATNTTTGGTQSMTLDSSGNLLVGTTSQIGSGINCVLAPSGKNAVVAKVSSTDNLFAGFDSFGSLTFLVASTGNVTNTNNSYGAISDVKLKQDIIDAGSQWDDLKAIRIRKFRFKNDPDGVLQIGVIAQELETVSSGLIDESPDFEEVIRTREVEKTREVTPAVLDEDGNEIEPAVTEIYTEEEEYTERVALDTTTKSVKYSVLYMKAVKALQEAMERIETLEAKVAALETGA